MVKKITFLLLVCCSLSQVSAMGRFRTAGTECKQFVNQKIQNILPQVLGFKTTLQNKWATFASQDTWATLSSYKTQVGSFVREKAENKNFRLGVLGLYTAGFLSGIAFMPKKQVVTPKKDDSWSAYFKSFYTK